MKLRDLHNWKWIGHVTMPDGEIIKVYSHINGSYYAYNKIKKYEGYSFNEILCSILDDKIYNNLIDEYIIEENIIEENGYEHSDNESIYR